MEELGLEYLFAEPCVFTEADLPSHVQPSPAFVPLQQKQYPTTYCEEISCTESLGSPGLSAGTDSDYSTNSKERSGVVWSNHSAVALREPLPLNNQGSWSHDWAAQFSCNNSRPLLHIAINSGHESIVRILLDEGEDINEQDTNGSTAVHIAVLERQDAILQMLLGKMARHDIADVVGQKPAHLAIYTNFGSGLKLLLKQRTKKL